MSEPRLGDALRGGCVLTPAALRALDSTVAAILRERYPGTVWHVERPERDALAAAGQVGRRVAVQEDDETLGEGPAPVRDDRDGVER